MLDARPRVGIQPDVDLRQHAPPLRRFLPRLVVIQDAALIYGALTFAYWLRTGLKLGPATHGTIPFTEYQGVGALLLAVMLPTLLLKGAYRMRLNMEMMNEIVTIFSAATTTVASVLVVTFMLHAFEYSRGVMVYLWILLIVLPVTGRIVNRAVQRAFHRRGLGVQRVLVLGASGPGKMIMQSIKNRPDLGYEVVGFVDRRSISRVPDFGRFRRLGTIEDIPNLIERERIDEIVIALPGSAHEQVWPVVQLCEEAGVGLKLVPDLFEMSLSRVQVDDIAGIPLLDVQEPPARVVAKAGKRALDLLVGSAVGLVSLPLITALAILIRLDSDGPAFIKQERVGLNGRRFSCLKLRSMYVNADQMLADIEEQNETSGPTFKMRRDPRVTRVGRYLRRFSLDELPQIWNVVLGDMSLVGPRPPLPREVMKYDSWQTRRLGATPGLTGLWQVSGRSDLTFDEMVMMDIMYVDNWTLALDIKILFRTVTAVLAARGAY